MNDYIFILGRTHELCLAELEQVLSELGDPGEIILKNFPAVIVRLTKKHNPYLLIDRLGGTVKIAQVIDRQQHIRVDRLTRSLDQFQDKKITFGLSFYSFYGGSINELSQQIKNSLIVSGKKVRFITPKNNQVLSSVIVKKQAIQELILIYDKKDSVWNIAKTKVVQDFESWNQRDYQRPCADPKSGMLPPKVARMMVNLVNIKSQQIKAKSTLLDPFCGMGTILAEALLLGWKVIGSDKSKSSISKTEKNLHWLSSMSRHLELSKYELFVSEAAHISQHIKPASVGAVVTEPYLGPAIVKKGDKYFIKNQLVSKETIKKHIKGLEKMYIGALREWKKVLNKEGVVVIVLPEVHLFSQVFSVKNPVDTCENLGYTLTKGPFTYSRPQAIVWRKIYIFKN